MAMKPVDPAKLQVALDTYVEYGSNYARGAEILRLPVNTFKHHVKLAREAGLKSDRVDPNDPAVMRTEIETLQRALKAATKRAAEAELTERKIMEEIRGLKRAKLEIPVWMIEDMDAGKSPGVPTLFASDWHWDEVVKPSQIGGVNEFNRKIAKKRLRTLIEVTVHLLKIISPEMNYPGIVFPLGGDMISGNIHDELVATNQFNTMPTILDLLGDLIWAIKELLKHFPRVFVPCVTGNHGRNTHRIWTKDRHATSFDWLIYQLLAKHFEGDDRVVFFIPDGSDALYRVYGHRFLLTHGDQFRGGDGMIGALGPIIRGDHKKRSRNAQIDMEYDTMLIGHWHQYIHLSRLIVNGSLKGYDEYAYQNNFGFEPPQQALWINHPKHGITYRMPVKLDRRAEGQDVSSWVSIKGGNNGDR